MQPSPPPERLSQVDLKPICRLLEQLELTTYRPELGSELSTLEAILGEENIHWEDGERAGGGRQEGSLESRLPPISLIVDLNLSGSIPSDQEDTRFQLKIIIPPHPSHSIPRLELLARYIGACKVNEKLSGSIRDIFKDHPPTGESVLYDAIEITKEIVSKFYLDYLEQRKHSSAPVDESNLERLELSDRLAPYPPEEDRTEDDAKEPIDLKEFSLHSSQPIIDRKSVFVGHSAQLVDPKDVPRILSQLLSDKKIAKASHNIVAWRCEYNGCLHQDNDDDGETAAGSRMQHLLNILDVKNVFVCVSRWFGGIHLGADRFKHINQATRDALLTGGFITSTSSIKSPGKVNSSGSKKKR